MNVPEIMTRRILGVRFFSGPPAEAVEQGMRGGLIVVPSAPVLVGIEEDGALRASVLGADLAITDSGLMVLMWWLLTREKLERVSGLEYLKLLLEKLRAQQQLSDGSYSLSGSSSHPITNNPQPITKHRPSGRVLWVMPTVAARDRNLVWLQSTGHRTTTDDCYLAPMYPDNGSLMDGLLLEMVGKRRPAHIVIALGGGVQERLGWFLKQELEKERGKGSGEPGARTGIHCIGAAIGFLSGEQVRIPMWVDYLYLGWLWRTVSAPGKFLPRYWKARRLVGLMWRYRERAPVAEQPS